MEDIEKKIESMYLEISSFGDEAIPLSRLTTGLKKLDAIRTFLLVLFLACRAMVQLWQDVDLGEIYVSIKKGDSNRGEDENKV